MRDCVILINDRLVSLSHTTDSSSLNTQLLSLLHASASESSVRLKKSVLFVCLILNATVFLGGMCGEKRKKSMVFGKMFGSIFPDTSGREEG